MMLSTCIAYLVRKLEIIALILSARFPAILENLIVLIFSNTTGLQEIIENVQQWFMFTQVPLL